MNDLFHNPFDAIVAAAYGSRPPISTSPLTPPFLPSQRTTYEDVGSDPAYAQLEEELMRVLKAKRKPTVKSKLGNTLRAGLTAAAMPNRAFGGPMDTIAAIAGGLGGAQDQDILQQKLFDEEQGRQARSIQAMLEERRRKAVAGAQAGSYAARAAYDNWRMNKPPAPEKYTYLTPGGGQVLKTTPSGATEWIPVPGFKPPATEEEKATARLDARVKKIAEVEEALDNGTIDEAGARTRLKAIGADIPPKEEKMTWEAAAKVSLARKGVTEPDALQLMTEAERIKNSTKPIKQKNKARTDTVDESLANLHATFRSTGRVMPGDDKGVKQYYQDMLAWFNALDANVRDRLVPKNVYGSVVENLTRHAGKALSRRGAGGGVQAKLDEVLPGAPKTTPTPTPKPKPSDPSTPKPKTVKMKAPNGVIRDVPADQVEHYKKRGATVVDGGMA